MRSAILILIAIAALQTGWLAGHNQGFEIGKQVGAIDAMFKANNVQILHNGRPE